jgi:hypothetical protein
MGQIKEPPPECLQEVAYIWPLLLRNHRGTKLDEGIFPIMRVMGIKREIVEHP